MDQTTNFISNIASLDYSVHAGLIETVMEHATSSNGDSASAKFSGQPADSSGAPTSVAAAAPESSTLAVKLSEDQANSPEAVYRRGSAEKDLDNKRPDQPDSRSLANTGEGEGGSERGGDGPQSQVIRRSRSGRLLRTTVQYDERSSRGSSPEDTSETQGSYSRRTRSSVRRQDGEHSGDGARESNEQDRYNSSLRNQKSPGAEKQAARQSENNSDKVGSDRSYYSDGRGQGPEYREDNRDELATDEDQEEDGYAEDGDDVQQEEGSESMDNNSSKNGDGGDPLVVSMYGSPSLVKVRSMFIDKLYKMVEDPSIQHLISWAKEGDMFYVFNCIELSSSVLPKFFKHNNWQSFVRQLNIYRYDREESTLNRRNPETQRWQFYHPDFQRDRPHLRSNIKRKSARSINIAPTFSRVVFERDKGYYVQQDSSGRPFSGHGGHNRAHSSIQLQESARHGYMHDAIMATHLTLSHTRDHLTTSSIHPMAAPISASIPMLVPHLLHSTPQTLMVQSLKRPHRTVSPRPMDHLHHHRSRTLTIAALRHRILLVQDVSRTATATVPEEILATSSMARITSKAYI
ncbi:hypothetical protein BGZ68_002242 [Mortierella alpina]|nr:hypothetical protein BGZ68_002242 [Mortierella alpina]